MARPIKETPVLTGKDAERFRWHMSHPSPASSEEKEAWEELIKEGKVPVSNGAWIDDPEIAKNWNLNGVIELVEGSYEIIDYDSNSDYLIIDIPFIYQK